MYHPGQRRGLRLRSSGAKYEGSERIVTALGGLLQRSTIAGEGRFTRCELKQWSPQREGGPIIK